MRWQLHGNGRPRLTSTRPRRFLWMIRISGGIWPDEIREVDYFTPRGEYRIDDAASQTMKDSLMYKMCVCEARATPKHAMLTLPLPRRLAGATTASTSSSAVVPAKTVYEARRRQRKVPSSTSSTRPLRARTGSCASTRSRSRTRSAGLCPSPMPLTRAKHWVAPLLGRLVLLVAVVVARRGLWVSRVSRGERGGRRRVERVKRHAIEMRESEAIERRART